MIKTSFRATRPPLIVDYVIITLFDCLTLSLSGRQILYIASRKSMEACPLEGLVIRSSKPEHFSEVLPEQAN